MAVTHKLCGKTLAVPPSLCMRCFAAADIKRAVAAERRRTMAALNREIRKRREWHDYPAANVLVAFKAGFKRVRSGRKRAT